MNNEFLQSQMEELFHKNRQIPRIRGVFEADMEVLAPFFDEHAIDHKFGLDLLVQMVLHKRATPGTMIGILRRHFDGDSQRTADELTKAMNADLVDYDPSDGETGRLIIKFDVPADVHEDLARYQYPLPMVSRPRKLTHNRSSAYLVEKGRSVILKDNHHDEDVCLDHLNRVNSIPLKINHATVNAVKDKWKGTDRQKPDETRDEFQKRRDNFLKYVSTVSDVHNHIEIAGGTFHLTHRYDKRGRTYCQGFHCNYQGNDWQKASIEFANEELVEG